MWRRDVGAFQGYATRMPRLCIPLINFDGQTRFVVSVRRLRGPLGGCSGFLSLAISGGMVAALPG